MIAVSRSLSLKEEQATHPSAQVYPSESGIFVFLIGLKAFVQKDTSLLFDFVSVIHKDIIVDLGAIGVSG